MHKHARVLVAIAMYGNEAVQILIWTMWMKPLHCDNPIGMSEADWRIHPDYEDKVPTLAEIEGWRK